MAKHVAKKHIEKKIQRPQSITQKKFNLPEKPKNTSQVDITEIDICRMEGEGPAAIPRDNDHSFEQVHIQNK